MLATLLFPHMAPANDSKPFAAPTEQHTSLYGLSALLFGCICFIFTPILQQDDLFALPTRREFFKSGLKTSTQHEALGFCPICKDRLFEAVRLPCSHIYCDSCIRAALTVDEGRCPYCRRILFGESVPWEDISDRAKFTFWCITLVSFLTLNIWASAKYLQWRSEMMWRWDYFLETELLVQLIFVALMSWIFPVPVIVEPEDQD